MSKRKRNAPVPQWKFTGTDARAWLEVLAPLVSTAVAIYGALK